ncbi:MAG: glycosyltransferase [Candidatus Competibacter sp.]|nr:glycosyltransferase [Candidatus Competibacter sp.]MDG4584806.1 glycosyltransferase [Candidatus Competibacter sp.]
MSNRLFLTWTDHRRSRNLAPEFGADYVCMESNLPYPMRVIVLSFRTLLLLITRRPTVIIAQNPSLALAVLCCIFMPLLRYVLVVDRHSNFKLDSLTSTRIKMRLFHTLSKWSVRKANVTFVTNENLRQLVESWGGTGVILPDRLPQLETEELWQHNGITPFIAVFIASYDDDEPLAEVLDAARQVSDLFHLYITGNYKRAGIVPSINDKNISFTGFLSDGMYVALLTRADLIIVLTSEQDLLNCGTYESVALGKPIMLSNSKAIKAYFDSGALYVDNSINEISNAFRVFPARQQQMNAEIKELRNRLERNWQKMFLIAQNAIDSALKSLHD